MQDFTGRAGAVLRHIFENIWHYTGSLAAVCLFAAVLGLGIYHAVVQDAGGAEIRCFAGVVNPVGAEPPRGVLPLGGGNASGVPHVRMEYAPDGRVSRMRHVDADGRLSPLPGSCVAEQLVKYDSQNRLSCRMNRNAAGEPAEDAQGVATREFDYDAAGHLVGVRFRDARGRLTVPRFPGYAECRLSYDAAGRPRRVDYLDAAGEPVLNAAGEQSVLYSYGADGSVTRENRVGGLPADNHAGVARETLRQIPGGTLRSWQNAAGKPVDGVAAEQREHHPARGLHRSCLMDAAGRLCESSRACAEHLQHRNAQGNLEWECYSGADGLPVNHPALGYAEHICEYSPLGELQREFFWDAAGNPAPLHERRVAGNHALTLHSDGSTAVQPMQ